MALIAIIYGTTEGQTRRIADVLAVRLRSHGHDARVVDSASKPGPDALAGADAAVIAGSVHMNRYQAGLEHFVRDNAGALAKIPNAFLSVSLSAVGDEPEDQEDTIAYPELLFERAGWRPDRVHHVAGALRYTQYDFFKRWIMRRIAKDHDLPTRAGEDHEFTDWKALESFADSFASASNLAA